MARTRYFTGPCREGACLVATADHEVAKRCEARGFICIPSTWVAALFAKSVEGGRFYIDDKRVDREEWKKQTNE